MAIKIINTGETGNLVNDPLYNFGLEDDFVFVDSGNHTINPTSTTDPFGLSIVTGAGRDTIDTTNAAWDTTQWIFSGQGDDTIIGGSPIDILFDGSGNDFANLGGNSDHAYASAGNDIINGGSEIDWVKFEYTNFDGLPGTTLQLNTTGVVFSLQTQTEQNLGQFGVDRYLNFENVSGGDGADRLFGSDVANKIYGQDGNDVLVGGGGNDELRGQEGRDMLVGGLGADTLNAGDIYAKAAARDTILFQTVGESGLTAATRDVISYFDRGGLATDDKIDLSRIDANVSLAGNQAFQFLGVNPTFTTGPGGQVRLQVVGSDTLVHVDNDADVASEMTFLVQNVTGLTAIDFIL